MKTSRVNLSWKRPDRQLVDAFRGIPAANLDDVLGRMAAVHPDIRPMNGAHMVGTAFTVRVPAGDNLFFHYAMDLFEEGNVVVIDAGGYTERAIFGSLMTSYCISRGVHGIVVDGCIRDVEEIRQMHTAVYAKGVCPNGPYKNGPGTIGEPVCIGGQVVRPGDILVGDGDGIVVVRPEIAEELLREVKNVEQKEADILKNITEKGTYDRPWVKEKVLPML